jgi:hypothetical protein
MAALTTVQAVRAVSCWVFCQHFTIRSVLAPSPNVYVPSKPSEIP